MRQKPGEVSLPVRYRKILTTSDMESAVLYVEAVGNDNMDLLCWWKNVTQRECTETDAGMQEDYIQKCMDVIEGICEVSPEQPEDCGYPEGNWISS